MQCINKLYLFRIVGGIHQLPVDSPHKGPVTRKLFPFDHVIEDPGDRGQYYLVFALLITASQGRLVLLNNEGPLEDGRACQQRNWHHQLNSE